MIYQKQVVCDVDYLDFTYCLQVKVYKTAESTQSSIQIGTNSKYLVPTSSNKFYAVSSNATDSKEKFKWTVAIFNEYNAEYLLLEEKNVLFNGRNVGHFAYSLLDDVGYAPIYFLIIEKIVK